MGRMKDLLEDICDAEHTAWQETPAGRACSAEHQRKMAERSAAAAAERARRETAWAAQRPAEWREWLRVRLLLVTQIAFGDHDFDFDDFLKEVGRQPTAQHVVGRRCDVEPYRPGNLHWVEEALKAPASPCLNSKQAAAYLGIALQTLRNKRAVYRPVNNSRPLMFDPTHLDRYLRGKSPQRTNAHSSKTARKNVAKCVPAPE